MVIKAGCLIAVSDMIMPFSLSGGDMRYPSFLLQVSIDMRINHLCYLAPYKATFIYLPKLQGKRNQDLC